MNNGVSEYEREKETNNQQIMILLSKLFPNLPVPYEYVYDLLVFLSTTNVNPQILPRVIRGIHNITIGTGKGQVIVHVQQTTMNVSVRETDEEMKTNGT